MYLKIGEDQPDESEGHLQKAVKQAIKNGMSKEGAKQLESLFNEYRAVFE